jgi:WD40 repeat protein
LVEGIYGPGGGFSDSAKLNLIVSVLDIFHKLAQAYDDRDVLFKTGDGSDMTLFGHRDRVTSLAVTESNHLLSASLDETTKLWDLTSGKVVRTFKALGRHHNGVAMLSNDKFVVAAKDGLAIFSTNSSDVEKEIKTNEEVRCVVVSIEDGYFLAGTKSTIIKYDSNTYEERDRFCNERASHIAILDSERFNSGNTFSLSKKCSLLKMTDKTSQEITLAGIFRCVCKVNASLFLTGSDKGIQLWDADNLDQCTKTFGTDSTSSLGIINDDLFVSGGWNPGVAKLWNMKSGECLATFKGHTSRINDVMYLPEQKAIATASDDHSIKVWPIGQYLEKANEGEDNNDNNDSNNADDHV